MDNESLVLQSHLDPVRRIRSQESSEVEIQDKAVVQYNASLTTHPCPDGIRGHSMLSVAVPK